jgi:hypothetical protein
MDLKDDSPTCFAGDLLPQSWRRLFLNPHPLLKATLQNAPLAPDFESGNLAVLDHSMQSPFGNL